MSLLVLVLGIAAAIQRQQIKRLTQESAYWENQAAEARHRRYETERRLQEIFKFCRGQESTE
jgi:hypothetical protein